MKGTILRQFRNYLKGTRAIVPRNALTLEAVSIKANSKTESVTMQILKRLFNYNDLNKIIINHDYLQL